jgi:hypothetical protein
MPDCRASPKRRVDGGLRRPVAGCAASVACASNGDSSTRVPKRAGGVMLTCVEKRRSSTPSFIAASEARVAMRRDWRTSDAERSPAVAWLKAELALSASSVSGTAARLIMAWSGDTSPAGSPISELLSSSEALPAVTPRARGVQWLAADASARALADAWRRRGARPTVRGEAVRPLGSGEASGAARGSVAGPPAAMRACPDGREGVAAPDTRLDSAASSAATVTTVWAAPGDGVPRAEM